MDEFLTLLDAYKPSEQALILKAYKYAAMWHDGVKRKSGEPYIIHPVAVASMLAEVHADADTVAAGLLHDTIEDCEGVTEETIAELFNPTIAHLVQGLTNINKRENEEFDKKILDTIDTKRILTCIIKDVRVLLIKLADRLHNMRTMEFQSPNKQVSKSQETLDFYVPMAGYIGEYANKIEMEDLAFKYIMPREYTDMKELRKRRKNEIEAELYDSMIKISELLKKEKIKFNIEEYDKSLFSLYKKLIRHSDIEQVHDFSQLKFTIDNEKDCYKAKKIIESNFDYMPEKAKDYIKYPKTNLYKALHTSIKSSDGVNIQCQFRTQDMSIVNKYGITAYFSFLKKHRKNGASLMQEEFKNMQFYKVLTKLVETPIRPEVFSDVLKSEILSERIYVKTKDGAIIELPKGSNPIDFAYRIHTDIGNHIQGAIVNNQPVNLYKELHTGDVVNIQYDLSKPPRTNYSKLAKTFYAKTEIEEEYNFNDKIKLKKN